MNHILPLQASQHGTVDDQSHPQLERWLAQLHGAVCAEVTVHTAGRWLRLHSEALGCDVDITPMNTSYIIYNSDDTAYAVYDNTQPLPPDADAHDAHRRETALLQVLLGARISGSAIDATTLALIVVFDTGHRMVVQPTTRDELHSASYWMVILQNGVSLDVGPERYYALEVEGDPLPPPPYRPHKLVQGAQQVGPDHAGRAPFAHEVRDDDDLAPVRAVLQDVVGQPVVSLQVDVHQRQLVLHFGQPRLLRIPRSQSVYTHGDWSITLNDVPIAVHSPADRIFVWDETWTDDAPDLEKKLVGRTLTQADVLLADLGLALTFDDGTVLTARPARDLVHPPADYRRAYWQVGTPDRPERLLDVGPGRYVSYLLVPGRW